ncbi:transcription-repair coupling factor [Natranaerobius trueperi]|nr:transcription-repair coupling factor [Natranaerobius trueperi]
MSFLTQLIKENKIFQKILPDQNKLRDNRLVSGLSGSETALLIAGTFKKIDNPVVVLTYNNSRGEQLYGDLKNLLKHEEVFYYSDHQVYPFELTWHSKDVNIQRSRTMKALLNKKPAIYVFPLKAAQEKMSPANKVFKTKLSIKVGDTVSPTFILEKLLAMGYENVSMVEQKGHFSHRGGILDIYPMTSDFPIRIEFFDDEIESIRSFDLATQRSLEEFQHLSVEPAGQLVIDETIDIDEATNNIEKELNRQKGRLIKGGLEQQAQNLQDRVVRDLEAIRNGISDPQFHRYLRFFYPNNYGILTDYLSNDSLLWVDEPHRIQESADFYANETTELSESLVEEGKILPSESDLFYSIQDMLTETKKNTIYSANFLRQLPFGKVNETFTVPVKPMTQFYGQWNFFIKELSQWVQDGYQIVLFTPSPERAKTLRDNLKEEEIGANIALEKTLDASNSGQVIITVGELSTGFILQESKLAVITFKELWGEHQKKISRRRGAQNQDNKNTVKVSDYRELKVEDYVVHEKHGIGKYLGIKTLEVNGLYRDYLHIKYAGDDSLYVPTDQINEIQKYVGKEGKSPKLYSLGSNEWKKVKQKVKSSVKELAQDLIKLYAERSSKKGYAFSEDTPWQKEFEDYFPHELTPDQEKAVSDIKKDLESEKVMDRLLCGDVGYGKTEVAMRGAFKVVMEGKQVCVLVPTTILAQQHYQTFKERFAPYPIDVRVLSRFSTKKEQDSVKKEIKDGNAEILIGTHKLLSKDMKFKDLGLLIIDEEQRFGVQHKEKIKLLKKNVDVLTMTATPIPRTLHMSLVGVRDLSVIETPPEGRYPVQTYVMEYSPQLIREAITRELNRGGQVYVVNNRIQGINTIAKEISRLVPEARVGVGHGQMAEKQLEKVMLEFLNGEKDVLVATSIVEAGLDIQNVNTIIINQADKMGLSQLYQLRGRVGRSNRMAYAYLTYQKDKVLTQDAEKRLKAIKEFTELGAGFKLALRDLEIRGAGNILGPEQHGFIMAVGFDMYTKMLKDAVNELQEGNNIDETKEIEGQKDLNDVIKVELNINAYIPASYISDHEQKIAIYKKVGGINSYQESEDLKEELKDRFGPLPQAVINLIQISRIKVVAKNAGINLVSKSGHWIIVHFDPDNKVSGEKLLQLTQKFPGKITVASYSENISLKINVKNLNEDKLLSLVEDVLNSLQQLLSE